MALYTLGGGRLPSPDLERWTNGEPVWESPPLLARLRQPQQPAQPRQDNGTVCGILTDRDIAIRLVAQDKSGSTPVAEVVSDAGIETVEPGTVLDDAIKLMRNNAVRRLPVVQDGRAVGIVSLGDMAIERDSDSALADVSAAKGNT